MADLNDIDETQPADTEVVSLGASRIRTERAAIKGYAAAEHTLDGKHAFPEGPTASRPAPDTTVGRLYINTDRSLVETTVFGIWAVLHTIKLDSKYTAGSTSVGSSFTQLDSLTINASAGANLLTFYQAEFALTPSALDSLILALAGQFTVDGVALDPGAPGHTSFIQVDNTSHTGVLIQPWFQIGIKTVLTEGAHTLAFLARDNTSSGSVSVARRTLGYLLF